MSPDVQEIVRELAGTVCRCGQAKRFGSTFCAGCFYALPLQMGRALYRPLNDGYLDAYRAAVAYLEGASAAEKARLG